MHTEILFIELQLYNIGNRKLQLQDQIDRLAPAIPDRDVVLLCAQRSIPCTPYGQTSIGADARCVWHIPEWQWQCGQSQDTQQWHSLAIPVWWHALAPMRSRHIYLLIVYHMSACHRWQRGIVLAVHALSLSPVVVHSCNRFAITPFGFNS
jgi:hypothetical protein